MALDLAALYTSGIHVDSRVLALLAHWVTSDKGSEDAGVIGCNPENNSDGVLRPKNILTYRLRTASHYHSDAVLLVLKIVEIILPT